MSKTLNSLASLKHERRPRKSRKPSRSRVRKQRRLTRMQEMIAAARGAKVIPYVRVNLNTLAESVQVSRENDPMGGRGRYLFFNTKHEQFVHTTVPDHVWEYAAARLLAAVGHKGLSARKLLEER